MELRSGTRGRKPVTSRGKPASSRRGTRSRSRSRSRANGRKTSKSPSRARKQATVADSTPSFKSTSSKSKKGYVSNSRAASLSLYAVLAFSFVTNVDMQLFLSTVKGLVQDLGGTDQHRANVTTAFSASRLVFTPIIGYWSDRRSFREVFAFSLGFYALANFLHAFATQLWHLYLSRVFAGFGIGILTVVMAYIATVTSPKDHTTWVANYYSAQAVGNILGPFIAAALGAGDVLLFGYRFSQNKMGGLIPLGATLFGMGILLSLFSEPVRERSRRKQSTSSAGAKKDIDNKLNKGLDVFAIGLALTIWFVAVLFIAVLQSGLADFTNIVFGWEAAQVNDIVWKLGAGIWMSLLMIKKYAPIIGDQAVISIGWVVAIVAMLALVSLDGYTPSNPSTSVFLSPMVVFYMYCVCYCISYALLSTFSAVYGKVVSASHYKGLFTSFLVVSTCLARIIAPQLQVYLMHGEQLFPLASALVFLCGCCLAVQTVFSSRIFLV